MLSQKNGLYFNIVQNNAADSFHIYICTLLASSIKIAYSII
nr:MAG TPA: hypothetical protein [Caudoviricetes sp.]